MSLIRSFARARPVATRPRILLALVAAAASGALACADEVIRPQCVLATGVDSLSLTVGQTAEVRATPSCIGVDAPRIRWSSSAPAVATVDSTTGLVRAVSAGVATLQAAVAGIAGRSTDVAVIVSPCRSVLSVTITPSSLTVPVGGTGRLRATAPNSCTGAVDSSVAWTSADASIATVDAGGTVRGVRAGQTVVRATLVANTSLVASVPVTVTRVGFFDPPNVSPTNVTLGIGGTQRLVVHVPIQPGAPAGTDTTARFRSSDSCVATVSADGLVFGRWQGTASVAVFAAADTNLRTAVGVTVIPTPIGPRLNIRSVASGTPPVEAADRIVHGLVTVTFAIYYDIAPNGGRLDVTLGGRLAVSQPIPPIATSPTPSVVSVAFDSDARDAAGGRLFANGILELRAGVVPNPPAPGGCMPTGAGQQVSVPLTIANP